MKLPISLTTVTPFSKLIALIFFIQLPFIGFYTGMKYQQVHQFYFNKNLVNDKLISTKAKNVYYLSPEESKTTLKKLSYKIPSGWTLLENNNQISLRSSDAEFNLYPALTKGAEITIMIHGKISKQEDSLLREYVYSKINPVFVNVSIIETKINNKLVMNVFSCWEGCFDHNFFIHENYIVNVRFECADVCKNKASLDKSEYAETRNEFLKSIVL